MAELKLTDIVQRVDQDKLVIPDFQRGFKWQTPDIRKLLESLLLDFPIGAALLWRTRRETLEFRRIEDVEFADGEDDEATTPEPHPQESPAEEIDFILDGQQRITSIYKLFPETVAPSEHELASRFKGLRFFLALDHLGLPRTVKDLRRMDFEEFKDPDVVAGAIVEKRHPDLRKEYRMAGDKAPTRLTEENILTICQRKLWLPLTRGFLENKRSHLQRLLRVVEADLRTQIESHKGPESLAELKDLVVAGLDRWADWFTSSFQATLNSKSLTCLIQGNDKPEGLARIFETINSTGLSLSVFDLLVARLGTWKSGTGNTNLRKLVVTTVEKSLLQRFDDDRSLGGTASQQLPRLLALRTGKELKKGEILKAKRQDFLDVVGDAGPGLQAALATLVQKMGVIDESFLPFKDLIALIGATHSLHKPTWEVVQPRVVAYLLAACLVEDWDSSTNDKTRFCFRQLGDLLTGKQTKEAVTKRLESSFPAFDELRDATSKASLIYRTFMAFNFARGGVDWAGGKRAEAETKEDHHIFAKDWLNSNRDLNEDKQLWASLRDSVLNRIFVSKDANASVKAQTPPSYLARLTPEDRRVLQIPESFMGPLATPIKSEKFTAFLKDRYDLMKIDFIDYVRQNI